MEPELRREAEININGRTYHYHCILKGEQFTVRLVKLSTITFEKKFDKTFLLDKDPSWMAIKELSTVYDFLSLKINQTRLDLVENEESITLTINWTVQEFITLHFIATLSKVTVMPNIVIEELGMKCFNLERRVQKIEKYFTFYSQNMFCRKNCKIYQDVFTAGDEFVLRRIGGGGYDATSYGTKNKWNYTPMINFGGNESDGNGAEVNIPEGFDLLWIRVLNDRFTDVSIYFLDGVQEKIGRNKTYLIYSFFSLRLKSLNLILYLNN